MAFPAIYERVKAAVANDKIVTLKGKLDLTGGKEPSVIIDDLKEFDTQSFGGKPAAKPALKRKQPVLWLNASALSDADFDDMLSMLSNYEGDTVCAILRGDKKYRLPTGVNYCRGLLAELSSFIFEKDIKYVE